MSLHCTRCDNTMTFGFASPSMRGRSSEDEMLEAMAVMVGWTQADDGKWICGKHRDG